MRVAAIVVLAFLSACGPIILGDDEDKKSDAPNPETDSTTKQFLYDAERVRHYPVTKVEKTGDATAGFQELATVTLPNGATTQYEINREVAVPIGPIASTSQAHFLTLDCSGQAYTRSAIKSTLAYDEARLDVVLFGIGDKTTFPTPTTAYAYQNLEDPATHEWLPVCRDVGVLPSGTTVYAAKVDDANAYRFPSPLTVGP